MRSTRSHRSRSDTLPLVLLGLMLLGSAVYYAAGVKAVFDSLMAPSGRARLPFDFSGDPRWLVRPLVEAQNAGIQPHDEILAINRAPFTGMASVVKQVFHAHAGDRLGVTYRNLSGTIHTSEISLLPRLLHTPGDFRWALAIVLFVLFPAFCLCLGYAVVAAKPWDRNGWFFLGIMCVVPVIFGLPSYHPGLAAFSLYWQIFARKAMFICLVLLGVYFPSRLTLDRRFPWAKWVLVAPQIAMIPYAIVLAYGLLYRAQRVWALQPTAASLHTANDVLGIASAVFFLAAVAGKLFTIHDPDAHRRLRVVAFGSFFGLAPMVGIWWATMLAGASVDEVVPPWAIFPLILLFALFPLSLSYTVLVQRALDVRVFLRQGTRYALARGTLWVLQALVLIYLGYRLIHFTHESGHHVMRLVAPAVFVVAVFLFRLRIAQPLSRWLDRRFFREEYSAERVLVELSEQVRGFNEIDPLIRTVFDRLDQTLHIAKMAVFLRRGEGFELQYAQALPDAGSVSFGDSPFFAALWRDATPLRIDPKRSSGRSLATPEEMRALQALEAELVLPLQGRTRLMGIMSLGRKLSEEPYSSADRRLLQSVALQTGLAIENSELVHTLAEEAAHRDRMNREMEIAQEVQERLFPQSYPRIEGVDMAGLCRTAQRIGGDYFDFLSLENGSLGIAIGDVSGKGISAALLMASIRAALRGLTLTGSMPTAEVMRRLNWILCDSSASNRFTTFFFGEYDPATGRLEYVNAGHEAPVLLRADCSWPQPAGSSGEGAFEKLTEGGPVMGIFPEAVYRQGSVELMSGDLLIAFTDGLSEAMTSSFEEWGEKRLIAAAWKYRRLCAREIADSMLREAERFTAGAPQNDDLTVSVVKMKEDGSF